VRDFRALIRKAPAIPSEPADSLPAMPLGEHVLTDYATVRMSLKAHPMAMLRGEFARHGYVQTRELAAAKLRIILRESEIKFGRHQTGLYHAGFIKIFELLSLFPGIALRVDHLRSGYRRYRFESHIIFSTVEKDTSSYAIYSTRLKISPKTCFYRPARGRSNLAAHTLQEELHSRCIL
jgi:hypothetical protein